VAPDVAELSDAERAVLVLRDGPRRDEWISGRIAMRRVMRDALGASADAASVLIAPDGAPLVVGAPPCGLSLSHDGPWIAVAFARGAWRLGVDLCQRVYAERAARILGRLGVRMTDVGPCAAWAALEATLKLRRMPVMALREHALEVRGYRTYACVHGLGPETLVELDEDADAYVVAFTWERAG